MDRIERYTRELLAAGEIGHDYMHVNRVRRRALQIAEMEGYPHLDRVEAADLLHDVGLVHGRARHGELAQIWPKGFYRRSAYLAKKRLMR